MDRLRSPRRRKTRRQKSRLPHPQRQASGTRRSLRFRRSHAHPEIFRPRHAKAHSLERRLMAVAAAKIKSAAAAQSPFLSTAMFSPAVLYILLLVAGPFLLAVFYAFSDARIGNSEMHFVGLENFRSILQSPSFRIAIRNSLIFTICSQIVVIVGAHILAIALEE